MHNAGVVGFFTTCNLSLTLLQWYWGYLILRAVAKMLSDDKKKDKPKKQ